MIKINLLKVFFQYVVAFFYSLWMASIPHELFKDRVNYLGYITSSDSIIEGYIGSGKVVSLLFNEPIFLFFNYFVYEILNPYFNAEDILKGYVFFVCFVICTFLLKARNGFIFSVLAITLYLLVPSSYSLQLGALRQAIGLSIILIALMRGSKVHSCWFLFVVFLMGFVHSFYFIMFFVVLIDKIVVFLFKNNIYSRLIATALFSLFVSYLSLGIASLFGVRQADFYLEVSHNVSGSAFLLWFLVFIGLIYNYKRYVSLDDLQNNVINISLIGLASYLTMYWVSPMAGRFLAVYSLFSVYSVFYRLNLISLLLMLLIAFFGISLFLSGGVEGSFTVTFIDFLKTAFFVSR